MELYIQHLALGQSIQVLSLLTHVSDQVTIRAPNHEWDPNKIFKSIFCVPDSRLRIVNDDSSGTGQYNDPGDHAKVFSPYIRPQHVKLFGQTLPVKKVYGRPCVAISMAKDMTELRMLINQGAQSTGDARYYDYEVYNNIVRLVLASGFDVITLNTDMALEHKVNVVSQLCEAVIGYEGGIAHLAHCFDIPCIMLPWQPNADLIDDTYGIPVTRAEKIHMDKSTWFLQSADEILSWTTDDLKEKILQLHQQGGNNKVLSQDFVNAVNAHGDLDRLLGFFYTDPPTQAIIKDYMPKLHIGGFPELALTLK